MLILILGAFALFAYYFLEVLTRANEKPMDEQDLRIHKIKQDRLRDGCCMWCGRQLASRAIEARDSYTCPDCYPYDPSYAAAISPRIRSAAARGSAARVIGRPITR